MSTLFLMDGPPERFIAEISKKPNRDALRVPHNRFPGRLDFGLPLPPGVSLGLWSLSPVGHMLRVEWVAVIVAGLLALSDHVLRLDRVAGGAKAHHVRWITLQLGVTQGPHDVIDLLGGLTALSAEGGT
jgi:hypothetical protein